MEAPNRRKRSMSFNPNSEFISDAVNNFLKKGGKIKRLNAEKINIKEKLDKSWVEQEDNSEADDFLNE